MKKAESIGTKITPDHADKDREKVTTDYTPTTETNIIEISQRDLSSTYGFRNGLHDPKNRFKRKKKAS